MNLNTVKKYLFFAAILSILIAIDLQGQGGWTREKGQFFGKLDVSHLKSNKYYNSAGTQLKTNYFEQTALQFYAEYGITSRFTVITSVPLLRLNRFETTDWAAGQGDLRLEAKYRLTTGAWPIALSIAPELPTGRANAFASNKSDPLDRINLPTGDGELNVWTTLAASRSFGKWYASTFSAYNKRTKYRSDAFRDQYQIGAEIGVQPVKNLWINSKLRGQGSIGESKSPNLSFVRGDATTYTLLSLEAYYQFNKNLGFSATYLTGGNWVFPFKNIYIAPYFSVGVVYQKRFLHEK